MAIPSTLATTTNLLRRGAPQTPPTSGGGTGVTGNVILTNQAGPVVSAVPVTTGIPFPQGTLYDLEQLRIEDVTTAAQYDAQFDELARWPDNSFKSVLVNYTDAVGVSATTKRLRYGPGTSRTTNSTVLTVSQNAGITTVTDGTSTAIIDAKGNLTSVTRNGETILTAQELYIVESAVAAREFTSTYATAATITIEESGPVRACIRAEGTFRSSANATYIQYVIRYYIHITTNGSFVVDIDDTFVDQVSNFNESSGLGTTLTHASRALGRRGVVTVDGTAQYRFGGETNAIYAGNVTGEHYLHQTGSWPWASATGLSKPAPGHVLNYAGVGTGTYAAGFVNLQGSTGNKRVGIFVKDMWQNYPMELNINTGTFDLRYMSSRGISTFETTFGQDPQFVGGIYTRPSGFYSRTGGIAKTYRTRFSLHGTAKTDAELHQENTLFQRNDLECMAPQSWYFNSKVWGELKALNAAATTGQVAWVMQMCIGPQLAMLPTQSGGDSGSSASNGNMTLFGWRDYGDRSRIDSDAPHFQQGTHVGGGKFLQLFLMTLDKRFWQVGFTESQHVMDIDYKHAPTYPYGNYGAPTNVLAPAGATRYIGHSAPDHDGVNDFSEHYNLSAMPDMYLLTGCRRSMDVMKETAGGWLKYLSTYMFKLPFAYNDKYREADRYYGYPIIGMTEYVRATNDWTYHRDVTARAANYMIGWWKTPSPHFGWNPANNSVVVASSSPSALEWPLGTPIGTNDYTQGTGAWASQRADNSYQGVTTQTSPWFTFPTLSSIILYREQELAYVAAGRPSTVNMDDLNMMLFQILQYLVTFCYDYVVDRWPYSETARASNGFTTPGDSAGSVHNTLGVYPMLYITRLYDEELAAGRIANPSWFSRSIWGTLNTKFVNMMRNTSATTSSQPYSVYGYETPWPNAFWKLADDMGF